MARAAFQFEDTAGADFGADTAADATGASEALIGLSVGADIDAHFAVFGAHPAGDAHILLHRDAVTAHPLNQTEEGGHGAGEAAPDAGPSQGIEPDADDAGEDRGDDESVVGLEFSGEAGQLRVCPAGAVREEEKSSQ